MNKLAKSASSFATALVCTSLSLVAVAADGDTLFGDATLVSPGFNSPTAAQIRSDASIPPNYGGVDFRIPSGLTVAGLGTLSTDYEFTVGSCWGGAPRFQVNVTTPANGTRNIFIYIGPPPNYTGCPPSVWSNTGNLAAPTNLVDATQIGGGFYELYAAVQSAYGGYPVTGIQVVVDAFWAGGTQTVLVDNVMINNAIFTFEAPNFNQATGGGQIAVTGGKGTFGFNAKQGSGGVSGHLNYMNHVTSAHLDCTVTAMTGFTATTATFSGTCGPNSFASSFMAQVEDNAEPGKNADKFKITYGSGPVTEGGTLISGNIQIGK
jgi:hypothetical protein